MFLALHVFNDVTIEGTSTKAFFLLLIFKLTTNRYRRFSSEMIMCRVI